MLMLFIDTDGPVASLNRELFDIAVIIVSSELSQSKRRRNHRPALLDESLHCVFG